MTHNNPQSAKGPSVRRVPHGDTRERLVCPDCGFIDYKNPKIITAAVFEWQGRVLLCRRAIAPRQGYWTMPSGFLELDETVAEGAIREAWEEAGTRIEIIDLLGIYDIPRIGEVYLVHRARMLDEHFHAGPESSEVRLFSWSEIPWDQLAFPSVTWTLRTYRELRQTEEFRARVNDPSTDTYQIDTKASQKS